MKGGEKQLRVAMVGQKTILSRKGGVEVVVKELSERMVKKGIMVTCYNRREKGEKHPKEYNGIKMKYAWTIRAKGLAALTSSFFATIMILFSKNDVVHYHAEGPCAWMWIIKFFSKKRIVATIHGLDWQRAKWGKMAAKWIMHGEKMAAKYADEIIVLSRGTQKYFKEKYNREAHFIPNGVSLPETKRANRIKKKWGLLKGDYILYLGRIVPEKGVHYLIEAFNEVDLGVKLVIAGDTSDTDDYHEQIKKRAHNNKNIIFTGFVEGEILAELYSNTYVYILPSDVEGMPLSLLEALSYGCFCITSDIEECKSILPVGHLTFRAGDAASLKQALCGMKREIDSYDSRKTVQYVIQEYDWGKITSRTCDLYSRKMEAGYGF